MFGKIAILWLSLLAPCFAQDKLTAPEDKSVEPELDYPAQLEFTAYNPCRGSASFCGTRILARGVIDKGSPARLRAMLADYDYAPTLVFDSPGGSLTAGLALGELIRSRGMDTEVGPEYQEEVLGPGGVTTGFRVLASNGGCFSACAYAFMGGVSRTLAKGGKIGVHQFHGAEADGESLAQSITAVISQYMLSMGVDRDVLDVAGLTGANDIALISPEDAARYNLDNQSPPQAKWELAALEGGVRAVRVAQQRPGEDGTTTIILIANTDDPTKLFAVIGYGPLNKGAKTPSELPVQRGTLCGSGGDCAELLALKNWEFDGKRNLFVGYFSLRLADLAKIVRTSDVIAFDAGLPNALSGYDASVELGTDGLRNALLAIY